ncbi:phosphohistidine phosphatase SixA [Nitrosomonas sp.]|uniref:phosphohistidine phosphatase SixA n=1 Tax=Nitrosomonas sp. TaxID=42353 RepID=UPI001D391CB0|nr:phosphohistidine phosphatase SixA [Nitrosomonas sp.]MBX3617930.1 phosphohistidine phosphatase SixA [Nitrosomonas sp.]
MELILWRHAEAENNYPDTARKLTSNGLDQAKRMADWLRAKLPENTRVIVSPTMRTQQTATALTEDFVTNAAIGPGANVQAILDAAGWPGASGAVVIVGHQPTIGEVVSHLIPVVPSGLNVRKGSVWWIRGEEKNNEIEAILHAVIYPDML